ncbi:MAG TPA: methyltransferase domain-containing protein, partial [Anaerolineales bacterium]|nr:methyltransferase domain-containing protein [Anaerolineales bacterium]
MPERKSTLSLFIVSHRQSEDWAALLPAVRSMLATLNVEPEILIVSHAVDEHTREVFEQNRCILLSPKDSDYGTALRTAIQQSTGEYLIAMDADQAAPFDFLCDLWEARQTADIVIGSRYIPDGNAGMPLTRRMISKGSNFIFGRGLDLQVRDMSSAFRLYRRSVVKNLSTESKGYDILQEILVKARMEGYQIRELPFRYQSSDPAFARAFQFGWAYFKTFTRLWKLRNSIASADYDARAYNALMPPQRYWQRQRYKIITGLIHKNGNKKCLDVGCGSSRIIGALPKGSLAIDILLRKLRYARRFGHPMVQGSIFDLPVPNKSFPCVLCSQVIEHVPRANVLDELDRVLQPGGFLILGTPDYANWEWRLIEWLYKVLLPQAYADEHITHYT